VSRIATILGTVILVCGFVSVVLGAMPRAHRESVVIGVNVANPQRLSPRDREAILDQLQAAGVRVIRAPLKPPWGGNDYTPAIDFVRRAFERGIKTDLIVHLQYRAGAVRRPVVEGLPEMWPAYPLSSADPMRFRAVFEPLFEQLEGFGITFAALELGNEINSSAFNGEFPVPGEGRVFGQADLARDPEAAKIAEGYRAYVQILKVLKDIRDHSRLNRATPILSAGLSDPGPPGPRRTKIDAIAIGATLKYLRANGMDLLVDAYGVHAYPWAKTVNRRSDQLEQDTLAECQPPGQGKPCWVTEWGLPAGATACGNEPLRAALTREILADFHEFTQNGRVKALLYYAWLDNKYGIYRCRSLTNVGLLALSPELPE
jgi:hypothetical protein